MFLAGYFFSTILKIKLKKETRNQFFALKFDIIFILKRRFTFENKMLYLFHNIFLSYIYFMVA